MNIKQLKYVCAIIDSGSFSSAAATEGVSVQAVSKAMAELENKLGTPLFERMSAGVKPTSFGRAFAVRARRVLDEWDSLERFAKAGASDPVSGGVFQMGFCCPQYSGVEKFCMLISTVTGRVLGRKVEVTLEACSDALDDLRAGKFDGIISLGGSGGNSPMVPTPQQRSPCSSAPNGHANWGPPPSHFGRPGGARPPQDSASGKMLVRRTAANPAAPPPGPMPPYGGTGPRF